MTETFSPNGVRPSSIPYEPEDESDRWFRLQRWRERCSLAAPKHTALLMRIEEGSRREGYCWMTDARLAKETGLPIRTVGRYLMQEYVRRGPKGRPVPVRRIRPLLDFGVLARAHDSLPNWQTNANHTRQ
jgi:hypothetical protein